MAFKAKNIGERTPIVITSKNVLAGVLMLQDRVGVRQSGHFDHDSHAMTGPSETLPCNPAKSAGMCQPSSGILTFHFVRDEETGEILSK